MNAIIALFISVYLVGLSLSKEQVTTTPCILYSCLNDYNPVCGKQKKNGCWEEKIFQNQCYMLSANSCGRANYIPCVENQCPKLTTPVS